MANKTANGLRHIGTQGRSPLLFLGYWAGKNEVAVIDLKLLRPEESAWLIDFISQDHVYNARTLSEPMNQAIYTQNTSAFSYFLGRATPLPFYEVNVSDRGQCYEWTKTDSRVDPRLPDHPFINRLREMIEARKSGTVVPLNPATPNAADPTTARSGSGDVMDTVREFMKTSGQAAAFIAKPDADADKSGGGDADRLSALEARFDRLEKLLAPAKPAAKPAKRGTKK